ncbi:polyamine transporter tpo5 [Lecanora helva]
MYGAVALSLSEMAARYPTAGGQYHWTALLAPSKWKRGLSYCCGSINVIGRVAMTASIVYIVAQLSHAMIAFYNPSYKIERWHIFLSYQVLNIIILTYNVYFLNKAPWTHKAGFIISLASFFVISITCLARTHPKQSNTYVWSNFINHTGWESNGLVFLLGLINPTLGFGGLDGAVHLAEDSVSATKTVPQALCYSLVIGFATSFFFVVSMLYCVRDIDTAIASRTGVPIYEFWFQATRSRTAATVFMASMTTAAFIAAIGSVQSSSRLTWSFARDDATIFASYLKLTNGELGCPVWSLLFNAFGLLVLGCVYLISSSAFNVFISTAMITELISFAFPAALLMYRSRHQRYLPKGSPFNLGKFGWLINAMVVGWAAFLIIIFSFPVQMPATPGSMSESVPFAT